MSLLKEIIQTIFITTYANIMFVIGYVLIFENLNINDRFTIIFVILSYILFITYSLYIYMKIIHNIAEKMADYIFEKYVYKLIDKWR